MIRPICVTCGVMYAVKKQGVVVANMASFGAAELINADKLECPSCGNEIIGAFADQPFIRHFEDGFAGRLTEAQGMEGKVFLAFQNLAEVKTWEKAGRPI